MTTEIKGSQISFLAHGLPERNIVTFELPKVDTKPLTTTLNITDANDPVTPGQRKYIVILCQRMGIDVPLEGQIKSFSEADQFIKTHKEIRPRHFQNLNKTKTGLRSYRR